MTSTTPLAPPLVASRAARPPRRERTPLARCVARWLAVASLLVGCGPSEEAPRSRAAEVVVRGEDTRDDRSAAGEPGRRGGPTAEEVRLDQLRLALAPTFRPTSLGAPRPDGPRATFVDVRLLLAEDFDGRELVHVDLALSADDIATRAAYGARPSTPTGAVTPPSREAAANDPAERGASGATPAVAAATGSPAAGSPAAGSPAAGSPAAGTSGGDTPAASSTDDACEGLDLSVLAERAPKLTSLRVSGCRDALHAGLGTFGARLQVLELADVELDDVLLDRIRQLSGLRALVLSRVRIGSVTPEALATLGRNAAIEHLVLRELETDSLIADLLGDISTLKIVQLEGAWAGHRAMTSLSRAKRLEALGLVDTNVGNFSLNQVEGLSRLREVEWVGATFNDYSPLHLRDLPIERFRCACSRFGDAGVRHLAYLPRLADLELSQGRFQARALEKLSDLAALERLVLMDVPLDEPDLAGLARLPRLRVLVIGNASLVATAAPHLGELTTLRELHLDLDGFGDLAAPELSTLTALEVLDLGAAPLSDDAIAALAPLASLRVLLLHGSRVTNRGLQTIGGLAKLERLDLDHTDVVDAGIARISGLSSLRSLRLDHTLITDAALPSLAELESLQELDLSHTVVTDAGVATLAKLPALARLSLAGTRTSAATRRAHSGSSAAERSADAAPATGGAATDAAHGAVDQTLAAPIPTADTSRLPGDPRPPEAASPPEGARSPGDSTKSTSPGEASRANE